MNTVHEIHGEVNLVTKEEWYKQLFEHLEASKFRRSFHLKQKDIDYINEKGLDAVSYTHLVHIPDFAMSEILYEW